MMKVYTDLQVKPIHYNFNWYQCVGSNNARLRYNFNNSTQAFTSGTLPSVQFSTQVWNGLSPFIGGATQSNQRYDHRGNVRFKVLKTGTTITVYATQTMGDNTNEYEQPKAAKAPGDSNPYSLLFSIDLTDKTTWTSAPKYAVGDELAKFTGATKFGYLTNSQKNTQFFDIVFSGNQVTNDDVLYTDSLTNPGEYEVSEFNEIDGCWEYSGEVTGYTGDLETVTVSSGYTGCTDCLT